MAIRKPTAEDGAVPVVPSADHHGNKVRYALKRADGSGDTCSVCWIENDTGRLSVYPSVSPSLGLDLDPKGRIKIEGYVRAEEAGKVPAVTADDVARTLEGWGQNSCLQSLISPSRLASFINRVLRERAEAGE